MDKMTKRALQACLVGASVAALAVLAGCNESPPPAPPPPPVAAYEPAPPPPALLGAPPPQQEFVAMAPIPNPEDMSQEERAKIYGARYHTHYRGDHSPGWWPRLHGYRAGLGAHPVVAAPVHAVASPAPKIVAAPPPKPVVTAPPSPIDQLAIAVAAKSKGVMLAVPADLSAAKPGAVTVSLPADLFAAIRQEAAKLGLGRAARKTDVTATLHGDGYAISPSGPQTAHLVPGKPTIFTWQVTPGAGAKGPLTADVGALLNGAGAAKSFSLAELKQAVAAVDTAVAQAEAATHGFKLPGLGMLTIPGHPDVTLPVLGKTPSGSVVGAVIALIVLLLLVMAARSASARREAEERQRRSRARAAAAAAAPVIETVTPVVSEPYVEPVIEPPVAHETVVEHAVDYPVAVESTTEPHIEPVVAEQVDHAPVVEHVVAGHGDAEHLVAEHAVVEAPVLHVPDGPSVVGLKPAEPESHEHPFDAIPKDHPAAETHDAADHEPAKTVLVETHDDHHALETV